MNIIHYLNKYQNVTFEELEFNELDSLILSELSYMNLDMYVPRLCDNKFIVLKDMVISDPKAFSYGSVDHKNNLKMFELMKNGKRFEDLQIGLYKSGLAVAKDDETKQFFAVTYILPNNTMYIAFRGTDITINGWKEDFHMCFMETVPSQIDALKYTKNVLKKVKLPFYLGGHSKGGNLAYYSALNLNDMRIEKRLLKVYSFDGPGHKNGFKSFDNYKRLKKKFVKYMTNRDWVGMVYNETRKGAIIVSATGFLLGGHDPFTWKVDVNKARFIRGRRSKMYINSEIAFNKWLDSISDGDKVLACDLVFNLLKDTKTVYDLPKTVGSTLIHGKSIFNTYSKEERDRIKVLIKKLIKEYISINFKTKKIEKKK